MRTSPSVLVLVGSFLMGAVIGASSDPGKTNAPRFSAEKQGTAPHGRTTGGDRGHDDNMYMTMTHVTGRGSSSDVGGDLPPTTPPSAGRGASNDNRVYVVRK